MRSRLAKALILALLAGPLFTFVNEIIWTHGAVKYDPPISQSEIEQLKRLPMAEMETKLAQRRVSLSRKQWLADSVGYSYFWKGLAESSLIPAIGVFLACLALSFWERRNSGSRSKL